MYFLKHNYETRSSVIFFLFTAQLYAQDTTRILFIGNSFTYFNNLPQIVKDFADSAGMPVITGMHAPGGISVGDISQGTQAHMYNPVLFNLIRSRKWDIAVIQDNQGRFVRDSAVFSSASMVVQGHLNIMDSVKANNSCAKVVLFAGWALKNGLVPFGNTGIESIQRIMVNYRVINDTMKEVVAPIGDAWVKAISYFPAIDLWDPDEAHPSYAGSYLTAATIFSTIFQLQTTSMDYNGSLTPSAAGLLRAYSDSVVFKPSNHSRYNLGGIKKVVPQYLGGQLSVTGNYAAYRWYKDNNLVGATTVITASGNGNYRVELQENDNCIIKSCIYKELTTALREGELPEGIKIFPNPIVDNTIFIGGDHLWIEIQLIDLAGREKATTVTKINDLLRVATGDLKAGCYILKLTDNTGVYHKKIIVTDE